MRFQFLTHLAPAMQKFGLIHPPPPGTACSTYDASDNLKLIVEGKYTVNSVDYKRRVIRSIRVCAPALNKLRVRGFK